MSRQAAWMHQKPVAGLHVVRCSDAEFLYRSLDFIAAGVIPRYARGALTPEIEGTTIMYKELPPTAGRP